MVLWDEIFSYDPDASVCVCVFLFRNHLTSKENTNNNWNNNNKTETLRKQHEIWTDKKKTTPSLIFLWARTMCVCVYGMHSKRHVRNGSAYIELQPFLHNSQTKQRNPVHTLRWCRDNGL